MERANEKQAEDADRQRHRAVTARALPRPREPWSLFASYTIRHEVLDIPFRVQSQERFMGLGAYPDFSLKQARERATAARQLLTDGIDPIDARDAEIKAHEEQARKARSFLPLKKRPNDISKFTVPNGVITNTASSFFLRSKPTRIRS